MDLNDILFDKKNLEILDKIDIGTWSNYQIYSDKDQLKLQKENFIYTELNNGYSDIKFIYTKEIARLNELVMDMSKNIPIVDTKTIIEDEVFYTTKIEGAKTTRIRTSQLHNGANIDKNNEYSEKMIKNCFSAVKLLNLYNNFLDEKIIIKTWNILTNGCCDNIECKGEKYRIGEVEIGSFLPVKACDVEKAMNSFIKFYNDDILNNYPFIKAAIIHFGFETIHPFCDGNGRLGRLLMNNYLIKQGIESAKAVSFSMFIDKTRQEYDVAFYRSENIYFDCTPFIEYMMQVFYSSFDNALNMSV